MALSKVVPGQKITAVLFNEVIDGINGGNNSAGNGNTSIQKNITSIIQYPPDWVNNYNDDLLHSWTPENEWFKLGPLVMKEPIAIVNNVIQICELDTDCNNSAHDVRGQWYAGVRKDKLGVVLKKDVIQNYSQLYIYTNQLTSAKEQAYAFEKIFNIFINNTPTDPCLYTFQNIPPTFSNMDPKYKSYFDLEYKDVAESESESETERLCVVRNHPYYNDVEQTIADYVVPEKDCTIWLNLEYKRDPITNELDKSEPPTFTLTTTAPVTPYLGYKLWDIEDWTPVTDYRTSLVPLYSTPKIPKVYDSYFQYSVEVNNNNIVRIMRNNTFWYNNSIQTLPDYTPPSGTGTIWLHMKKYGDPVTTTFSIDMVPPPQNSTTDYGISLWVLNNWEVELDGRTSIVTFNDSGGTPQPSTTYNSLFDYVNDAGIRKIVRNDFWYNNEMQHLNDYTIPSGTGTIYIHIIDPVTLGASPTFEINMTAPTTGDKAIKLWELNNWDVVCDCRTSIVVFDNLEEADASLFDYVIDNNTHQVVRNDFWYNNEMQHLNDYVVPNGTGTIWLYMIDPVSPSTTPTFEISMTTPTTGQHAIKLWEINNWNVVCDCRNSIITFNDGNGTGGVIQYIARGPFEPVYSGDPGTSITGLRNCVFQWERRFLDMGQQTLTLPSSDCWILLEITHPTAPNPGADVWPTNYRIRIETADPFGNQNGLLLNTNDTITLIPLYKVTSSGLIEEDYRATPLAPVYR